MSAELIMAAGESIAQCRTVSPRYDRKDLLKR